MLILSWSWAGASCLGPAHDQLKPAAMLQNITRICCFFSTGLTPIVSNPNIPLTQTLNHQRISTTCWIMILPLLPWCWLRLNTTAQHHSSISQQSNYTAGVPSSKRPWVSSFSIVPIKKAHLCFWNQEGVQDTTALLHHPQTTQILHAQRPSKRTDNILCVLNAVATSQMQIWTREKSASINRPMLSIL